MKKEIIDKIVKASGIKKGELILIQFWGKDEEIEIMHQFAEAVAALGASPLEMQQSMVHNQAMFANAKEGCFEENYFRIFEPVDAVLDVFTCRPILIGQRLPEEQMKLVQAYMGKVFQTLGTKKRWTQIRIPTEENAKESNLSTKEFLSRMEQAYDLDYEELQAECEKKKTELTKKETYVIETGSGCQLSFNLKGREWIPDCGDGDWPCGEVYIAPNEEQTNGTVFYETLYLEDVGRFEGVTLSIENGVVTKADQEKVQVFFDGLSKEQKTICELGFGCNENVKELCGYTVLDEKKVDSFHIAIGNNTMFGGKNEADLHLDMVNDGHFEVK